MPVYLIQSCILALNSERACSSRQACTMQNCFPMQADHQGCARQCLVPWRTNSPAFHTTPCGVRGCGTADRGRQDGYAAASHSLTAQQQCRQRKPQRWSCLPFRPPLPRCGIQVGCLHNAKLVWQLMRLSQREVQGAACSAAACTSMECAAGGARAL